MNKFQKILHILSWIIIGILTLVPLGFGLIIVGLAIALKGQQSDRWPRIFWLWGNDEEGCPKWWITRTRNMLILKTSGLYGIKLWFKQLPNILAKKYPAWWWYAVRNPLNNMRFGFKDREAKIESNWGLIQKSTDKMEAAWMLIDGQQMAYRWAWNGMFAGYRRIWLHDFKLDFSTGTYTASSYSEYWVGWKVGSSVPGMGLTAQIRRNIPIGE